MCSCFPGVDCAGAGVGADIWRGGTAAIASVTPPSKGVNHLNRPSYSSTAEVRTRARFRCLSSSRNKTSRAVPDKPLFALFKKGRGDQDRDRDRAAKSEEVAANAASSAKARSGHSFLSSASLGTTPYPTARASCGRCCPTRERSLVHRVHSTLCVPPLCRLFSALFVFLSLRGFLSLRAFKVPRRSRWYRAHQHQHKRLIPSLRQ